MGQRPARGGTLPDRRDPPHPAGLTPGPFAPLAGLHTGQTGNETANRLIGIACIALTLAIVTMIAAQFLRAGVL